jgi:hypothetical protein
MLSMFASYVFGKAGGALGEALFAGELGKIAGGAISGSLDGAFSSLTGKGDLGASVLEGAAKGAAVAALEAVGEANKLTDADSNGDGSDATAVEARDKNLSISGRAGGTSEIPLTDERGRVVGKATIKYSPVSRYADEPIGRVGVDVRIDVEGVDADWVQNVRENGGPRRPDPSTSHDRPGLYYNSAERLKYGSSFIDGPRRTVPSTWTAELSLVTLGVDGRYHAMKTFSYGFSSSGTWSLDTSVSTLNVRAAPFIETRPSAFQLNSVRGIGRGP